MNEQDRAKIYSRRKHALLLIDLVLTLAILLFLQLSGLSSRFTHIAARLSGAYYATLLAYLILFCLYVYILSLPLGFYSGFVLEHAFGLSNQGLRDWAREELKKALITGVLFISLIELAYLILRIFPKIWWVLASCGWLAFSILFSKLFPVFILPIFYKCERIHDESLRTKILELTGKAKIRVTDVSELNLSKDTKKSNAAFVGWGDTRRIVLADNLVREFTQDEIAVVVAHEMAHYKLHHMWRLIAFGGLSTALTLYVFHLISGAIVSILGATDVYDIAIFPSFSLLYAILGIFFLPAHNAYSRRLEREADVFALELTGMREAFISLMEKLAHKNLAETSPSKIVEFFLYDHPPISKRIALARHFRKE